MNLTPDQKKWCEAINKGEIRSSESFLKYLGFVKCAEDPSKVFNDFVNRKNCSIEDYSFDYTIKNIPQLMKEFLALWCFLEKENMIVSSPIAKNVFDTVDFNKYKVESTLQEEQINIKKEISFIMLYNLTFRYNDYINKGIFPLPSLDKFIHNRFQTEKEIELHRYNRNTILAISISGVIAFASLVVSLFTVFKEPSRQPVEILNLDSAMEKYSRAAVVRARYEDSISKAHGAPRDTSLAGAGRKTSK